MNATGAGRCFEGGRIAFLDRDQEAGELNWNAHPKFKGVFLKHLVRGEDVNGRISCHLVRIEGGCEIGEHAHPGMWELHEIIEGEGKCILGGKEIPYMAGTVAVIPEDTKHRVMAEKDGLYLLAKFLPALA